VNNNYFNRLYFLQGNLDKVIELNSDPATSAVASAYGDNGNQIAASKIMKVWLYLVMTDTWGAIPYSEAGKLLEDVYYPRYDDQSSIYAALLNELDVAVSLINEDELAFVGGDMIYYGDASKWRKFGNSLKCRIAIHMSKIAGSGWREIISGALAAGVFTGNDDVAAYHYGSPPEYSYFYEGFFISARNDFTLTRSFIDLLKGQPDTLNIKSHPWVGVQDPRLPIYTTSRNGEYIGIPYGIPSGSMLAAYRNLAPNLYSDPPIVLSSDFPVPLMTYAELLFIISEYRDFSREEYVAGVEASIEYWSSLAGVVIGVAELSSYIESVSGLVNAESVSIQKYIDLYMNGTEAWTELRRTGYPTQLLSPGEISVLQSDGTPIRFEPLSDTKGLIISRVKYPTNESTLNAPSFLDAVSRLSDGTNNYYTPMFFDKRLSEGLHPSNK
jgi:hypothetical protein